MRHTDADGHLALTLYGHGDASIAVGNANVKLHTNNFLHAEVDLHGNSGLLSRLTSCQLRTNIRDLVQLAARARCPLLSRLSPKMFILI